MGYCTTFELDWKPTDKWKAAPSCSHKNAPGAKFCQECGVAMTELGLAKIVGDYIVDVLDCGAISREGKSYDSTKWYEHEADMRAMSKALPEILFHLSGEGEENGDIWDLYALNGKTQIVRVERPDLGAWK